MVTFDFSNCSTESLIILRLDRVRYPAKGRGKAMAPLGIKESDTPQTTES
jgi:hypothetical protein